MMAIPLLWLNIFEERLIIPKKWKAGNLPGVFFQNKVTLNAEGKKEEKNNIEIQITGFFSVNALIRI